MSISNLRFIFAILSMWFMLPLAASTSEKVFAKYPNIYFIETGSFCGDGIQMALNAGFQHVFSIELSPHYYQLCSNRFNQSSNVHLIQGDSSEILPILLSSIEAPATFWLDGHYSSGNTARGESNTPLLAELNAIAHHHIKSHTILIDDVRLFGTSEFDFVELIDIVNKLKEINPNYQIYFEDGYIPNDVLVAKLP